MAANAQGTTEGKVISQGRIFMWYMVSSWAWDGALRRFNTSRTVPGSIADGLTGIFSDILLPTIP